MRPFVEPASSVSYFPERFHSRGGGLHALLGRVALSNWAGRPKNLYITVLIAAREVELLDGEETWDCAFQEISGGRGARCVCRSFGLLHIGKAALRSVWVLGITIRDQLSAPFLVDPPDKLNHVDSRITPSNLREDLLDEGADSLVPKRVCRLIGGTH